MRKVMKFNCLCMMCLLILTVSGCAPSLVYTSTPSVRTFGNAYFEAMLEPVKPGHSFFTVFRLTLTNRAESAIEIGWNQSKYIHDGQIKGGVVFKGIRPADVKNRTIPPDMVPAGSVLTKDIAPLKLIAYAPYKSGGVAFGESGITAGMLPAGENGILLTYRYKGQILQEKITVQIKAETQKK